MCSAISIDFTFHPLWNIIAIHRKFQCDLIKFRSKKNVRERVEERETGKEKNNIHLTEENMKTLLIALFRHQLFMTMNWRKSRLAKQNKIRKASIFNFVSCNNGFYHCSNNFFFYTQLMHSIPVCTLWESVLLLDCESWPNLYQGSSISYFRLISLIILDIKSTMALIQPSLNISSEFYLIKK